ncbi:uncharacterized protein LOC121972567 [Zingiber officinale]|uniref:uncharacterized protein LOC121972567 n=1 Tax=Zingiber officinale TaxID=94328 RepID=UPI001C4B9EF5|nr:uncharacterized protein LOC121972567 [Zingiber officinale]
MDIPLVSSEVLVNAFAQGLTKGEFFQSLIQKSSRDFDHRLRRATEYINVEESQAARRKEALAEPTTVPEHRPSSSYQPPKGPQSWGAQPHHELRTHVLHEKTNTTPAEKGIALIVGTRRTREAKEKRRTELESEEEPDLEDDDDDKITVELEKAPYIAKVAKLKADYTKTMVAYNKGQSGGGGGSHAAAADEEEEEEGEESDKSKSEDEEDDE